MHVHISMDVEHKGLRSWALARPGQVVKNPVVWHRTNQLMEGLRRVHRVNRVVQTSRGMAGQESIYANVRGLLLSCCGHIGKLVTITG
jgi:hypothetical protein